MQESISSDFSNPKMLADQTFNNILDKIQKSNLNFQLQVSPFSAIISLKKSLVKDKSGSFLLPPSTQPSTRLSSTTVNTDLLVKISKLETDLQIQKNSHENALNKFKDASEKLRVCEENSTKLERENKALKHENKTLATKLEAKTIETNQMKTAVAELNKEKNVISVALKSVKQDLKAQKKASEDKLVVYEKKLAELNEFKSKKLNEERQERLRKKKERKREAKNNNIIPNKNTLVVKEEVSDEKYVGKNKNEGDPYGVLPPDPEINLPISNLSANATDEKHKDIELEYGNGSCSSSMVTDTDSSCAYPHSCALDPVLQISADTSENNHTEEEKEEGFVGPRLPRMMNNKEFKALMDKFFGDKYD